MGVVVIMKNNYQNWYNDKNKDFIDTKEKIKQCILCATLAPSSHNSQPWEFIIKGDLIFLRISNERKLPKSDRFDRELYISIGCALENFLIAARKLGINPAYSIDSEKGQVIIDCSRSSNNSDHDLYYSIFERTTNRNTYFYTESIKKINFESLVESECRINIVDDLVKKQVLAGITIDAGITAMKDKGFRQELSRYIKSNFTSSFTGMPGFGIGIPTPVSFFARYIVKIFNINKITKKVDYKLLTDGTPKIIVISSQMDNLFGWIKVGMSYERISLTATKYGFSTHPYAASIEIGDFYKEVQEFLEINERPQFLFRIGKSVIKTKHSPRLPINNVIKND